MVNEDARWLQSHILDVFEEHEEAFHYPVRSQKDARAFVKVSHAHARTFHAHAQSLLAQRLHILEPQWLPCISVNQWVLHLPIGVNHGAMYCSYMCCTHHVHVLKGQLY